MLEGPQSLPTGPHTIISCPRFYYLLSMDSWITISKYCVFKKKKKEKKKKKTEIHVLH